MRVADSYQASGMAAEARRAFEAESSGKTLGTEGHHDEYRGTYGASWTKQVPAHALPRAVRVAVRSV